MIKITERLTVPAQAVAILTLNYELRQKSRLRTCLDNGDEAVLILPRGTVTAHGDLLRADDGRIVEVRAADENVTTIYTDNPLLKARACYHLGNRHVALQISDHWVRYQSDHVLDKMIQDLGLTPVHELAMFEPEQGAYAHYDQDTTQQSSLSKVDKNSTDMSWNNTSMAKRGLVGHSLLKLIQLVSPTLPVGAYAYSQALEYAVSTGIINDESSALKWIGGLLKHTLLYVDVPLFAKLYSAWQKNDDESVHELSHTLQAQRESAELLSQDNQMGVALARLLISLGLDEAVPWATSSATTYVTLFTLAAVRWEISLCEAVNGYLWSWCDNQVTAAVKLVPLGQTAGQRILSRLIINIPAIVETGLAIKDHEIGFSAPGLGIFSALHETQYSRLYRS